MDGRLTFLPISCSLPLVALPPLPLLFRGSEAISRGFLTSAQLRGTGVLRLCRDIYTSSGTRVTHELRCRAHAMALPPGTVITGRSAATVRGVRLCWPEDDVQVLAPLERGSGGGAGWTSGGRRSHRTSGSRGRAGGSPRLSAWHSTCCSPGRCPMRSPTWMPCCVPGRSTQRLWRGCWRGVPTTGSARDRVRRRLARRRDMGAEPRPRPPEPRPRPGLASDLRDGPPVTQHTEIAGDGKGSDPQLSVVEP